VSASATSGSWRNQVMGTPLRALIPEMGEPYCQICAPELTSIGGQPMLIGATRCYLIQMLGSALTWTNGCSCWSPDEENSPQIFLTMDRRRYCACNTDEETCTSGTHQHTAPTMIPDRCCIDPANAFLISSPLSRPTARALEPHTAGFASRPCRRAGTPAREPGGTRPRL
jgi:hypothetical protein